LLRKQANRLWHGEKKGWALWQGGFLPTRVKWPQKSQIQNRTSQQRKIAQGSEKFESVRKLNKQTNI